MKAAIALMLIAFLVSGCTVTHGNYRNSSFAGGMFRRVSTGTGETVQLNLLWIPVYTNY